MYGHVCQVPYGRYAIIGEMARDTRAQHKLDLNLAQLRISANQVLRSLSPP